MPSALTLLSDEKKCTPPSAKLIMEQLQLPILDNNVSFGIMQLLGYKPVSYGYEQDNIQLPYFSTTSTIKRSLELQEQFPNKFMRITSCAQEEGESKNRYNEQTSLPHNHDFIILNSPYYRQLSVDSFVPLDENHIDLLNTSWEKKQYLKFASAQLLAGSIIVTQREAILVNCLEVYSRIRSLDAHIEKEAPNLANSIPNVYSQYTDLTIVKLQNDNSAKLIIGTQISNLLVTSSIRIDDDSFLPELGPTTANFKVTNGSRIYLSQDSIKKFNAIVESKQVKLVLKHEMYNLKQIRSKFHRTSTYTFSRGFSLFTHSLMNVPVTVFTAQYCRHIYNNDAKVASGILSEVAWGMVGGDNKLYIVDFKKHAVSLSTNANATISLCVKSIENMFDGEEYLLIIDNEDLNALLEILAKFVSNNGVTTANQKIAENVRDTFKL